MCSLTETAMQALCDVAAALQSIDDEGELTPFELRTLMWSRCSLAALYGIRVDEEAAKLIEFSPWI